MSRLLSRPVLLTALALALLPGASPCQSGPILTVGKVTAKGGNSIRGIEDGVIFNRRFGDDCLLDAFPAGKPVAASLGQELNLEVELISCPPSASLATSQCRSEIENGPASAWIEAREFRLTVPVPLPASTGIYRVRLVCRLPESTERIATELFLAYASPRPMVDPPDPDWYRRACQWGEGLTRDNTEQQVADRILDALFLYGQRRWRYGLCRIEKDRCVFGPTEVSMTGLHCNCGKGTCKLDWTELVSAEGDRNFSDCYQFSSAFEYVAATMGIGGMVEEEVLGSDGVGFVTKATIRSLDPAFGGNLKCGPRNGACAFAFGNHDLRRRGGRFYDATFGGIYGSPDELIFQSIEKLAGNTLVFKGRQDIACNVGFGYGSFKVYRELGPGEIELCPKGDGAELVQVRAPLLDSDLAVDVQVRIVKAGSYSVQGGIYCRNGRAVTLRPQRRLEDVHSTAEVSGPPGTYWTRLRFSGSDLRGSRSMDCAPYHLRAYLTTEDAEVHSLDVELPAMDLSSLGDDAAWLGPAEALRLAWERKGSSLSLRATLPVEVRTAGAFAVEARFARNEETLSYAGYRRELSRETDLLEVDFPLTAVPPEGGLEISISLHWLNPLQPVAGRRIENVELPPVK